MHLLPKAHQILKDFYHLPLEYRKPPLELQETPAQALHLLPEVAQLLSKSCRLFMKPAKNTFREQRTVAIDMAAQSLSSRSASSVPLPA